MSTQDWKTSRDRKVNINADCGAGSVLVWHGGDLE